MQNIDPRLSLSRLNIEEVDIGDSSNDKCTFQKEIDRFVLSTDSLIDGMPPSLAMLESAARAARRKLLEYVAPYFTDPDPIGPGSGEFTAEIPNDKTWKLEQLRNRIERREHALRIVSESFLVTLISQFDTFIGAIARAVLIERPQVLNASDRVLTFAQLQGFASMDDARIHLMDKEIDQLLRGSHSDQIEWFEKRMGKSKTPFAGRLGKWPAFVEATERRNVVIHADAQTSHQYLEVCRSVGADIPSDLTVGKRLNIDLTYYKGAYEATVEVGLRLGIIIWLQFRPGDGLLALATLNGVILNYISESKFALARDICDFGCSLVDEFGNDAARKMLTLNLAQCHKWLSDESRMHEVLNAEDWSAGDLACKLALAVLRDESAAIKDAVQKLEKVGGIEPNHYRSWPIFRKLRQDKKFQDLFLEVYGEPLADELAAIASVSKPDSDDGISVQTQS
jgi:hypothetical protein